MSRVVLGSWALTGFPISVWGQSPIVSYLGRELGLGDDEVQRVVGGGAVTVVLDGADDSEVATFSAFRVNRAPDAVLDRLRTLEGMLPGEWRRAAFRLSDPPQVADFEPLELGSDDIEELSECRLHDCDIKLPLTAIERFWMVDWSVPDAGTQATELARRLLLGYAQAYALGGNPALAEYHDKSSPQEILATFQSLLGASRYLYDEVPEFRRHIVEFPGHALASSEDYFFWAWEDFGMKPVLTLNHASIYQPNDSADVQGVLATMQIYASHYFLGALATTLLVEDPQNGDTTYVLRLARYRFDGPVGGLRRRLLERRLRRYAERSAEGLLRLAR